MHVCMLVTGWRKAIYKMVKEVLCLGLLCFAANGKAAVEADTFPPLKDAKVPQNVDDLWGNYDPRKEPLDIEMLKEWEDDGIVCRIVRYRVGIFKGAKAMMGAVYAFPKGAKNLPGLVQVHGGGQSANLAAAVTNARRGYACISLNWGCNQLNDGSYQKIWETPATDWGAVDGSHEPKRDPVNHFVTLAPNDFTLDPVESPRNSAWFLVVTGARRALTFLEQQPEVDGSKLGIYGHSMGGKLTVMTAGIDSRIKAAAPSCGGISNLKSEDTLEGRTIADNAYLERLGCAVIFLSPSNDFHGHIGDLKKAVEAMPGKQFRFTCAPNLSHRDTPSHFACGPLWFDYILKGNFNFPKTPECKLELKSSSGVPILRITPDSSREITAVDVYYTRQSNEDRQDSVCWQHVKARGMGKTLSAKLPLMTLDKPLRAYADVTYSLDKPVVGAGYYYATYSAADFSVSSNLMQATTEALRSAGIKATDAHSMLVEDFKKDWRKGWYTFNENGKWFPFRTNKINSPKWQGPDGAKLVFKARSAEPNLLVIQMGDYAAEFQLPGGKKWQTISIATSDLHKADGSSLADWKSAKELAFADKDEKGMKLGGGMEGRAGGASVSALVGMIPRPLARQTSVVSQEYLS